jgi:hypothetical protein
LASDKPDLMSLGRAEPRSSERFIDVPERLLFLCQSKRIEVELASVGIPLVSPYRAGLALSPLLDGANTLYGILAKDTAGVSKRTRAGKSAPSQSDAGQHWGNMAILTK